MSNDEEWDYPAGAFPADPFIALRAQTLKEFEEALGSTEQIRRALCRYFKRGFALSYSNGELVDFLCVSNDLLEEAGWSAADAQRVLDQILASLTDKEIRSVSLD
jgi:hypothetical protein